MITTEGGTLWLAVHLDLGEWHAGRKLVRPLIARVNGNDLSSSGRARQDDVHQWYEVGVPLPRSSPDTVTMSLRGVEVAVRGPWRLNFPTHVKR